MALSPQIVCAPSLCVPLRPEKRLRHHEQPEQPEQPVQPEQPELREQPELPEQGSRSSQSNQQVAEDEGVESLDASLLRASQEAALEHLDLASKHLADVSHMTDGEVLLVIVNKLVPWTECLLAACPQLSAGS